MRVLVIMNSLYTGGAEFSTLSFYQWMMHQGHSIKLVCLKHADPEYVADQFEIAEVTLLKGNIISKVKALGKLIREFKPDLVHSVLYEANLITRLTKVFSINFVHMESLVNEVYSSHRLSDPNVTWFKLKGYQLLDWLTCKMGVNHFHANGNSVSLHYRKTLGISANRISVVERGRNENTFLDDEGVRRSVREEFQLSENTLIITCAARQEFQKGYDILLKALSKLNSEKDWICLCAGRAGNMTAEIQKLIHDLNLGSKVKMPGHRNDLSRILAGSDIFVFPSRFEGLPGALIEAEAAGLPIVCSDIPNNREVVVEGENALLFPVDDAAALAGKLAVLIEDEEKRKSMGAKSLEIFVSRFSAEQSYQRLFNVLKNVAGKA